MTGAVSIRIDGNEVVAREGESILAVALRTGHYIPHLCAIKSSTGLISACRLCFVEVEGHKAPLAACTANVAPGMVVNTQSAAVLALVRTGFELLMASHPVECGSCSRKGSCELHRIAKHLGLKLKTGPFPELIPDTEKDESNPAFISDPARCVLCGRCIWICRERLGRNMLDFVHRSTRRRVMTFADEDEIEAKCRGCGKCADVCPTGALTAKPGRGTI